MMNQPKLVRILPGNSRGIYYKKKNIDFKKKNIDVLVKIIDTIEIVSILNHI